MNGTDMTFMQLVQANWLLVTIAVVITLLLALWLFGRSSRRKVRDRRPDVLDEGVAPAQRNHALIDTPPAASMAPPPVVSSPSVVPPITAGTMVGLGEVVARGTRGDGQAAVPAELADTVSSQPVATAPVPTPMAAPVMPSSSSVEGDDLSRIKGIGPKLVKTLHALGITRYAQIAAWTDADLDAVDAQLGAFAGRPRRDSWIEQASLLSGGDTAGYEAKFGKL